MWNPREQRRETLIKMSLAGIKTGYSRRITEFQLKRKEGDLLFAK
jgi:hypothetical protein